MPNTSSGMGTGTGGPSKTPKYKKPKKGTKTVPATRPAQPRRKTTKKK